MRFDLPRDDGYLTLGQFWEGNFTLKGVGTDSAREAAEKIALEHEGIEDTFHRNWVIPFRRGLALFERLDKLRAKGRSPIADNTKEKRSMPSYLELKAELATLNFKIDVALAQEKAAAIREIEAKMAEWGIRPRDLQDVQSGRRHVPVKSGR